MNEGYRGKKTKRSKHIWSCWNWNDAKRPNNALHGVWMFLHILYVFLRNFLHPPLLFIFTQIDHILSLDECEEWDSRWQISTGGNSLKMIEKTKWEAKREWNVLFSVEWNCTTIKSHFHLNILTMRWREHITPKWWKENRSTLNSVVDFEMVCALWIHIWLYACLEWMISTVTNPTTMS